MIKYIITREIEVEESYFESEQIGVFDTEKDAICVADSIHAEMNEFERYYYEIIVWKAIGDSIDVDDWETFKECYSVKVYPAEMDEAYEEQKHNVFTLLRTLAGGYEIYSDEAYTFDESKFDSVVASGKLKEPRVETEDPSIVLDESQNAYVVKSGVQGNMIDDAKLREAVRKAIDRTVGEGSIPDTIAVDIPDSVYTSVAPVGDEAEMKKEADAKTLAMRKQQILDKVKASSITYTFGSQTETLNRSSMPMACSASFSVTL